MPILLQKFEHTLLPMLKGTDTSKKLHERLVKQKSKWKSWGIKEKTFRSDPVELSPDGKQLAIEDIKGRVATFRVDGGKLKVSSTDPKHGFVDWLLATQADLHTDVDKVVLDEAAGDAETSEDKTLKSRLKAQMLVRAAKTPELSDWSAKWWRKERPAVLKGSGVGAAMEAVNKATAKAAQVKLDRIQDLILDPFQDLEDCLRMCIGRLQRLPLTEESLETKSFQGVLKAMLTAYAKARESRRRKALILALEAYCREALAKVDQLGGQTMEDLKRSFKELTAKREAGLAGSEEGEDALNLFIHQVRDVTANLEVPLHRVRSYASYGVTEGSSADFVKLRKKVDDRHAQVKAWTKELGAFPAIEARIAEIKAMTMGQLYVEPSFRAFCALEHSEENPQFMLDVEGTGMTNAQIFDTYIRGGSPMMLNLSGSARKLPTTRFEEARAILALDATTAQAERGWTPMLLLANQTSAKALLDSTTDREVFGDIKKVIQTLMRDSRLRFNRSDFLVDAVIGSMLTRRR